MSLTAPSSVLFFYWSPGVSHFVQLCYQSCAISDKSLGSSVCKSLGLLCSGVFDFAF